MKFTISSLAESLKIDYPCAVGLVKFLTDKKIVQKVSVRKFGKAREFLFEGPQVVVIDMTGREQC